jgi:tetrahydromethanopterin S-methyltransferase subunit C
MAEYVRRKRPPANHPYWARLHQRAHPPSLAPYFGIPAGIGLVLGLVGGAVGEFTYNQAERTVIAASGAMAGLVFLVAILCLHLDTNAQLPRRVRWRGAMLASSGCAAGTFVLFGLALAVLAWACWLFSGLGPWLGALTGFAVGAVPGVLFAVLARRDWRERQRQWPRWERMRAPRRRALTVTPIPLPVEPPATPEPPAGPTEGRPVAE